MKCEDTDKLDCVLIEIKGTTQSTIVGSLYRPPNLPPHDFDSKYKNLLKRIDIGRNEIIFGLDHNLDLLKSTSHKQTELFLKSNLEQGITPAITRPTRITKSTATLIDNIMISKKFCDVTKSDI